MFKQLIARTEPVAVTTGNEDGTTRLDRMKAAYEEWQVTQDIGAVMSALSRLSDRRLAMIGLQRDGLYNAVTEMMDRVDEEKRIADDVFALLDTSPAKGERPDRPQSGSEIPGEESSSEERQAA